MTHELTNDLSKMTLNKVYKANTPSIKNIIKEPTLLENEATEGDDHYMIKCPHKNCPMEYFVMKNELRCLIFRCGYKKFKNGRMTKIGSHAKKSTVDKLIAKGTITGCGQPFRVKKDLYKQTKRVVTETCSWV